MQFRFVQLRSMSVDGMFFSLLNLHIVNKFSFIHSYCAIHISEQRFLLVVVAVGVCAFL